MPTDPNAAPKNNSSLEWLKENVVHEIPIIGHTLTERNWPAFHHDMKHFFSMLVGMAAMMAIPMPMSTMSKDEDKKLELVQKFFLMTLYMYAGMFVGGVVYNIAKSGFNFLRGAHAVPTQDSSASATNTTNAADYSLLA